MKNVESLNRSIVESASEAHGLAIQRFNQSTISIANHQRTREVDLRLLKKVTVTLLEGLETGRAQLEINLLAASAMARLNQTFLHHAGPTDVIAFDYGEAQLRGSSSKLRLASARRQLGTRNSELETVLHGEIFICVDEAVRQARRFHTTWLAELVRYLAHGILHLRGYDDARPAARRRMKLAEDRLVRCLTRRFNLRIPT